MKFGLYNNLKMFKFLHLNIKNLIFPFYLFSIYFFYSQNKYSLAQKNINRILLENDPLYHSHSEDELSEDMLVINPRFGNDSIESKYLELWETKCLGDVHNEISTHQNLGSDHNDEYSDPLVDIEKDFITKEKFLEKIELTPFLDSIQNHSKMSLFDYNFKAFNIMIIVILFILISCLIVMFIFTFTKLRNKTFLKKKCCIKFCLVFEAILLCIVFVLLILSYYYTHKSSKYENDAICEATRIPHTLFFGNPEIHFEILNDKNFVGFENLRKYIQTFEEEKLSFIDGQNKRSLEDIKNTNLKDSVNILYEKSNKFFEKYETIKGTDASGNQRTPYSISNSLEIYRVYMNTLLDKYEYTTDRIQNIEVLEPTFDDKNLYEPFFKELSEVSSQIAELEIELSEYWNSLMNTSFDGILVFKMALYALAIMLSLAFLSLIILMCTFCKNAKIGKIKNKSTVRCLSILVCFLIIVSIGALFEISRGIFTSYYGCSLMLKFRKDPSGAQTLMEPYLKEVPNVKSLVDNCFFNPQPDKSSNFYNIINEESERQALQHYLSFFDGLKVVHETIQGISEANDKFHTISFEAALNTFLDGTSFDFDDVFTRLAELNYIFSCSETYYSLSPTGCEKMPISKKKCVAINLDSYIDLECDGDNVEAKNLFTNLKNYMLSEKDFIDDMIYDLSNPSDSILKLITDVTYKYTIINNKIKNLESNLDIHFSKLRDGPIEDWLDCTILKTEMNRSYEKLCRNAIYEMSFNADQFFALLCLMGLITIGIFALTFCFEEFEDYLQNDPNEFQTGSNVFEEGIDEGDHQRLNTMDQITEDKTFDQESTPFTDNFNTFKNQNVIHKTSNHKDETEYKEPEQEIEPVEFETYGDSMENEYKPSNIKLQTKDFNNLNRIK